MKVIIEGKVYDSQITPIVLAWDTDQERKLTGLNIETMEERKGPRLLISSPVTADGNKALDDANDLYKSHIKEPTQMTW